MVFLRSRRSDNSSPPSMGCNAPAKGEANARVADLGQESMPSPPLGKATTAHPAQAIWCHRRCRLHLRTGQALQTASPRRSP
eukprot:5352935-Pyramimonas_sp.AAC.1